MNMIVVMMIDQAKHDLVQIRTKLMLNYCEFIIVFPVEPILIGLENFNSTNICLHFFHTHSRLGNRQKCSLSLMFKRKLLFFLAKVVIDANIIFGKLVKISSVTTLFIFDFNITLMCRNRIRPKTKFKKKGEM